MAIPYAPSRLYEPDNSIIALIQRAGQQRAEGARRGGEIWGNTIGNIGQIAAGTVREIADQKAGQRAAEAKEAIERPKREREAELQRLNIEKAKNDVEEVAKKAKKEAAFGALLQGEKEPTSKDFVLALGPTEGLAAYRGYLTTKPDYVKQFTDKREVLKKGLLGLQATPEAHRPAAYSLLRQSYIGQGIIGEQDAPAEYDPNFVTEALNFGEAPKEAKAEPGFSLSPGEVRFDSTGKRIAGLPPKPEKADPTAQFMPGQPAATLTGDEYLKTLDPKVAGEVKAYAEGRRPFPP